MTHEDQLRQKLRRIEALYAGATTPGERDAAAAAIDRIRARLQETEKTETAIEVKFTMPDSWSRKLFVALCRRYGLQPFRYRGQRHTTVNLRAPRSFIEQTLWPEFQDLQQALRQYLDEATERIIREEVHKDAGEAGER